MSEPDTTPASRPAGNRRSQRLKTTLIIGLVVSCVVYALQETAPMMRAEHWLDDAMFSLRARLSPRKPYPAIRLVLLDKATSDALSKPMVFWPPYYARAMKAMLDAGARVVGLDVVIEYPRRETPETAPLLMPFLKLLQRDRGRVVLSADMVDDPKTHVPTVSFPCAPLRALVGDDNLAVANFTRDLDGVLRDQQVSYLQATDHGWPCLPRLLADKYLGHPATSASTIGINYSGPDNRFPTMSFIDVLHQAGHPQSLREFCRDSVVLIGPGRCFQDYVATPFSSLSPQDMLGVQAQAEVLSTLLSSDPIRTAGPAVTAPLLLCWCLLLAALAMRLPAPQAVAASLGLALTWETVCAVTFIEHGLILKQAPMLLAPALVLGAVYAWRERWEFAEKRRVKMLFGRQVSGSVMEALLANSSGPPVGSMGKRTVTVLFSDINGFSTMCESEPPEVIIEMLNRYYAAMTQIIHRYDGTIVQFVGDEIMVLFGAPCDHPDPERAAVRSALDMVEALESMKQTGGQGFYEVKIGIHTGEVTVGVVGSEQRSQFTVVGDNVNLGARLEQMAKPLGARVLISQATWERVHDMPDVEFIPRGERDTKGRQEKVVVYEARARKAN